MIGIIATLYLYLWMLAFVWLASGGMKRMRRRGCIK